MKFPEYSAIHGYPYFDSQPTPTEFSIFEVSAPEILNNFNTPLIKVFQPFILYDKYLEFSLFIVVAVSDFSRC